MLTIEQAQSVNREKFQAWQRFRQAEHELLIETRYGDADSKSRLEAKCKQLEEEWRGMPSWEIEPEKILVSNGQF
jgi:hypothetical protein